MLKLGAVKWRGKCSRHPMFDPTVDGQGAVKGGCPRCEMLVEISALHRKMLGLMRTFSPPPEKKKASTIDDRQIGLFEEAGR